jgi:hypothetical protein
MERSNGDGTFNVKQAFTPNPSYGVNNNNFNFKTGDFNGDGKTDLIHFIDPGNGYVHVLISNGDGTFSVKQAFTPSPSYDVDSNNFNFKIGDFNGDSKADLIHFADDIYIWTSNGNGKFDIKLPSEIYNKNDIYTYNLGDGSKTIYDTGSPEGTTLDGGIDTLKFGDSITPNDLALQRQGNNLIINSNFTNSGGGWSSQDKTPRFLADINGDKKADIIGFGNDAIFTALAKSDGTFGELKIAYSHFTNTGGGWTSQDKSPRYLADINGDGKADIVGFGWGEQVNCAEQINYLTG